jgi:hypothetical protein
MGTLKQAVEAIGTYGGEPRARTGQTARFLQVGDLLPIKAGKRLIHISATHLATLFLALATAPKPSDGTRCALSWGQMTPGGKPLERLDWDDPRRQHFMLIEVLTGCIGMVWKEGGRGPQTDTVAQSFFDISITRPHAVVTLGGRQTEYLPLGAEPGLAEFTGFHRVCRIPGTLIRTVAMALHEGPHHHAILKLQPDISHNPYRDPASVLAAPLAR